MFWHPLRVVSLLYVTTWLSHSVALVEPLTVQDQFCGRDDSNSTGNNEILPCAENNATASIELGDRLHFYQGKNVYRWHCWRTNLTSTSTKGSIDNFNCSSCPQCEIKIPDLPNPSPSQPGKTGSLNKVTKTPRARDSSRRKPSIKRSPLERRAFNEEGTYFSVRLTRGRSSTISDYELVSLNATGARFHTMHIIPIIQFVRWYSMPSTYNHVWGYGDPAVQNLGEIFSSKELMQYPDSPQGILQSRFRAVFHSDKNQVLVDPEIQQQLKRIMVHDFIGPSDFRSESDHSIAGVYLVLLKTEQAYLSVTDSLARMIEHETSIKRAKSFSWFMRRKLALTIQSLRVEIQRREHYQTQDRATSQGRSRGVQRASPAVSENPRVSDSQKSSSESPPEPDNEQVRNRREAEQFLAQLRTAARTRTQPGIQAGENEPPRIDMGTAPSNQGSALVPPKLLVSKDPTMGPMSHSIRPSVGSIETSQLQAESGLLPPGYRDTAMSDSFPIDRGGDGRPPKRLKQQEGQNTVQQEKEP